MSRCPRFREFSDYELGQFPVPEEASPVPTATASIDRLENLMAFCRGMERILYLSGLLPAPKTVIK